MGNHMGQTEEQVYRQQPEFVRETAYLQEVVGFAEQKMAAIAEQRAALRQEVMDQAEVMRDELTQVIRDFDDIIRLSLENDALTRVQKRYNDNEKEYCRLEKLKESPYFARIDFVDREFGEENTVYIGATGLSDSKSYQMYVCDWRAPVCELFYGFDTGEAWYETARGRMEVTLTGKRQFRIRNGEIQGMYDSESSVYDEILGDVLSGRTGAGLKVIVDSIQKEQNRAIRFAGKRNVLVYGPAGSGKTSVGMHRLAYLLYEQKDFLKAEDIVILSNNQIFSAYIAGILPQLCEEDVSHMIFQELLDSLLPREVTCEDFYEQYDAVEGTASEAAYLRRKQIAVKYSRDMLLFIEKYFEEYVYELPDLKYGEEVILTGAELNERMRRRIADQQGKGIRETYRQRLDFLISMVKKAFENYFLEHQERIRMEIAEQEIDEEGERLEGKNLQARYKIRRRAAMMEAVETIRAWNSLGTLAHLYRILEGFAEDAAEELQNAWNRGKLYFEDALLYVIVGLYTGEIKALSQVRHVLIDELQDYNPLQLYLVRLLYPKGDFTMLADSSQAVSSCLSLQQFSQLEDIWDIVSEEPIEKLALNRSYRSSAPINAFAFQFLQQFDPVCAGTYTYFQREGREPERILSDRPEQKVAELLEKLPADAQVGIITVDQEDTRRLYDSLQDSPGASGLQLVTDPGETIQTKRTILPLILSKGLEFDIVVLYRLSERLGNSDSDARKMYLGCTRALHELYLVDGNYLRTGTISSQ